MCLIVFSADMKNDSNYSFILLANRDEYHERPTEPMQWWKEGYLLAGKDLKGGGTWLGISKNGRFATVTNYREDPSIVINKKSRGDLVKDFLEMNLSAQDYLQTIRKQDYAGFNLLLMDSTGVHYSSNRTKDDDIPIIKNGVNALGNRLLNSPTNKVEKIRNSFEELLLTGSFTKQDLIRFMQQDEGDLSKVKKNEFINTEDQEIPYRFIKSKVYGTRCTTVYLIHNNGSHHVIEQQYKKGGVLGQIQSFEFRPKDCSS